MTSPGGAWVAASRRYRRGRSRPHPKGSQNEAALPCSKGSWSDSATWQSDSCHRVGDAGVAVAQGGLKKVHTLFKARVRVLVTLNVDDAEHSAERAGNVVTFENMPLWSTNSQP